MKLPDFFDALLADLRDAQRGLRRDAGFTGLAAGILAAMLAANMLLFAFLDAYFLRRLPIAGAERHFELSLSEGKGNAVRQWPLAAVERFLAESSQVVESSYAFSSRRVIVGGAEPKRSYVEVVTPQFFRLLRPRLAAGRTPALTPEGAPEAAILLSDSGWKRLLGAEPNPVGRTMLVDGVSLTVAGVLAEGEGGLEPATPDFWMLAQAADVRRARGEAIYHIGGVLREGVTPQQAEAALTGAAQTLAASAEFDSPLRVSVDMRPTFLREARELQPLALALLFLFGLVTLVAAANLTSLHLARATARQRDLAIRAAVGASRGRLVRHIVTESLLLAGVAAVAAWGLANAGIAALQGQIFSLVSDAGMSVRVVEVDMRIFAAGLALAAALGVGCGLVPAAHITKGALDRALRRDALWLSGRISAARLRGAMVVAQVALSLPLLVGAGILVRSAAAADTVDVGFDADRMIDLRADPATPQLLALLRELPGVAGVTTASHTPLTGMAPRIVARVKGVAARAGLNRVDENYFHVFGNEIVRGRSFHAEEATTGAPVAIVSESTARRFFAGRDAVGEMIELATGRPDSEFQSYLVVGVAADVVNGFFFQGRGEAAVYVPGSLAAGSAPEIVLRVVTADGKQLSELPGACARFGAFCEPITLRKTLAMQRFPFTVGSQLASSLGVLALGLACLSLYGLARFAVVQRTREFGIRFALGATRRNILGNVLGESARRCGWGVAVGLPVSLALSTLLGAWVPFLDSFYAAAYLAVPLLLVSCALLAGLGPALHAAAIDPAAAIRDE